MSIWKNQVMHSKKGKVRRQILRMDETSNGRMKPTFVSEKDIPVKIRELLKEHDEVDDSNFTFEPPAKACIFCEEPGTKQKFINLQTLYLCDPHYYSESTGKIVQRLREIKEGVSHAARG